MSVKASDSRPSAPQGGGAPSGSETGRRTPAGDPRTRGRRWEPLLSRATSSFLRSATVLVVVLAGLAAVVALAVSSTAPTRWASSTEVAPQLSLLDGSNGTNVFSLNIDGAKRFIDSQVALMSGRDVLRPVELSSSLSSAALQDRLEVKAGASGATVVITTRDTDPTRAYEITAAVVDSYRTVRAQQLRALAKTRYDVISSQLDEQRLLGLSAGELSLQLERDLAAILVPLNAGPTATLTVVSSPSLPEPAPNGGVLKALIAFLATAALVSSVLLLRRATLGRVLDARDIEVPAGAAVLGLLRRHDGTDVAGDRAASLLALPATAPTEVLVLSAVPEPVDVVAAQALVAGLLAAGRPAQLLRSPDDPRLADHLAIRARGWATQLPEADAALPPSTVLCLVLVQGMSRAEVHAAVTSVRQVSALPMGLLLLQGRTLP